MNSSTQISRDGLTRGSVNFQRSTFDHAGHLLRSTHKYPILQHEDAVYLTEKLDECLYSVVRYVNKHCDWFKNSYINTVMAYLASPADRNSYSSKHEDTILVSSLLWVFDPKLDWLSKVQSEVKLFRLYWMQSLNELVKIIDNYAADALILEDDVDYVHAKERCSYIENTLGISNDIMYGVACEIKYWDNRINKIKNKMTCPYLRRVCVLAKQHTLGDPDMFLDNLNSGVEGVHTAIGRYDTTMGSYAGLVSTWVNNKILTWVRKVSHPIRVPDRVYAQKRAYDRALQRDPFVTVEEVAKTLGLNADTLANSIALSNMQGTSQLLDEADLGDCDQVNEAYLDTTLVDGEAVNTFMQDYSSVLSNSDKVFLTVMFDCDDSEVLRGSQLEIERESIRQLLHSHYRSL